MRPGHPGHLPAGVPETRRSSPAESARGVFSTEGVRRKSAPQSLPERRRPRAPPDTRPPGTRGTRPRAPPGGGRPAERGGTGRPQLPPAPSRSPPSAHPSAATEPATGLVRRTSFLRHLDARREPGGGASTRSRPEQPQSGAELEHPFPGGGGAGGRRRKRPLRLRTPRAGAASGPSPRLRCEGGHLPAGGIKSPCSSRAWVGPLLSWKVSQETPDGERPPSARRSGPPST